MYKVHPKPIIIQINYFTEISNIVDTQSSASPCEMMLYACFTLYFLSTLPIHSHLSSLSLLITHFCRICIDEIQT